MSIYLSSGITAYCVFLAVVIGLVLGSFLNCVAWRVVSGESFLRGRSHCTHCGHTLSAPDLVPLFSWLILRGRCRYCHTPIPKRYPLTELAFAVITVTNLLVLDLTPAFCRAMILAACLFVLTLTDLDSYTIPDGCHIVAVLGWLVTAPFLYDSWKAAGLDVLAGVVYGGGLLVISLVMDHILKKESLGGGDIKLFAVMGLYLGFVRSLFALIIACLLGLVCVVLTRRRQSSDDNDVDVQGEENAAEQETTGTGQIPFGPSIAVSFWLMLLFGSALSSWYLGLLGL